MILLQAQLYKKVYLISSFLLLAVGCIPSPEGDIKMISQKPNIFPEIHQITIPFNIAPLNFKIDEKARSFYVKVMNEKESEIVAYSGEDGAISFNENDWKSLLYESKGSELEFEIFALNETRSWGKYNSVHVSVSEDKIDPFLCYRLIYPGYENWLELSIQQRNIENFDVSSVIENKMIDHSCVNCHNFQGNNPDKFMLHIRVGEAGGTYFVDGEEITKTNLKTEEMFAGSVYPSYHPHANFVAYSSNKVVQDFYAHRDKRVEVYDKKSSLVLYDIDENELMSCGDEPGLFMETFPSWSPDGTYLYYSRTHQVDDKFDIKKVKYSLCRKSFDPKTRKFGRSELIYDADSLGKSASFPRISPDGNYLVATLSDYGTFPIWHDEADLHLIDLKSGEIRKSLVNSNKADSYHSWSSNGKWMVFSSRRLDGLTTYLYLAHFSDGKFDKPFLLPQEDPDFYKKMTKSYNVPEFITGEINVDSHEFRKASELSAKQAKWSANN